jgi:hypothetical protein
MGAHPTWLPQQLCLPLARPTHPRATCHPPQNLYSIHFSVYKTLTTHQLPANHFSEKYEVANPTVILKPQKHCLPSRIVSNGVRRRLRSFGAHRYRHRTAAPPMFTNTPQDAGPSDRFARSDERPMDSYEHQFRSNALLASLTTETDPRPERNILPPHDAEREGAVNGRVRNTGTAEAPKYRTILPP